ncbi:MAG: Mur ligase domain-containing protein [Thermodesulfovibrionales bacterium]|nr:Mur ligase domain-containing protein [Thermodesulfovibrionales bacterium]
MKVFFSGIGGSGLSAIAGFMAERGHDVWGSDRAFDKDPEHPVLKLLKNKNIKILPQDGAAVDSSFDLAVFSTAVEKTNPEYERVMNLKIPLKTRPEFLIELSTGFRTFAVAGTSGKSTTSGMIAFIMDAMGMKPNFIGGGRIKNLKERNGLGNYLTGSSDILLIEACESDGTIIHYRPEYLALLNLELDHHPVSITSALFQKIIDNTSRRVIVNLDDRNIKGLRIKEPLSFSVKEQSLYRPDEVKFLPLGTEFILRGIRFKLSLPGMHNLYNALASIAILAETGVSLKDMSDIIRKFKGVERRFDIVLDNGTYLVIDDYAHNPHKIGFLIETVKRFRDSVCFIFQPHGYGPTRLMKDDYIKVFSEKLSDKDHLILLPIYYSGGTVQKDISSHDLASAIRMRGRSVEVIDEREEILNRIDGWNTFVVFGARDESLSILARDIAERLR